MNKIALALAMKVVTGFLSKFVKEIAQDIWDSLWRIVKECVIEAERKWKESGTGKQKAGFMVTEALKFLESKKKLNFIQRRAFKRVLIFTVERLIDRVNNEVGHDWVKHITDLQMYLAGIIPIIE